MNEQIKEQIILNLRQALFEAQWNLVCLQSENQILKAENERLKTEEKTDEAENRDE